MVSVTRSATIYRPRFLVFVLFEKSHWLRNAASDYQGLGSLIPTKTSWFVTQSRGSMGEVGSTCFQVFLALWDQTGFFSCGYYQAVCRNAVIDFCCPSFDDCIVGWLLAIDHSAISEGSRSNELTRI